MGKRGSDFLSHWISDGDRYGCGRKTGSASQGIPGQEIDEEIGPIFEDIMQGCGAPRLAAARRTNARQPRVRQGVANMQQRRHL